MGILDNARATGGYLLFQRGRMGSFGAGGKQPDLSSTGIAGAEELLHALV